jgi:hypothetical protein
MRALVKIRTSFGCQLAVPPASLYEPVSPVQHNKQPQKNVSTRSWKQDFSCAAVVVETSATMPTHAAEDYYYQ